ncbi:MAG TPA: class I SAM-dependent methyltransferase [Bacteroidales bacterium]|nr:class I SAM-dependent methyltransferase [Bacteroidales bacterium]
MQYDPIKRSLGNFFNRSASLRIFFYRLLDLLLLRAWHIHRELRQLAPQYPDHAEVLDAGSGFGQYAHYLHRLNSGWRILGLDLKQEQVDDCNRFFTHIGASGVSFATADLTQLNFDNRFHLVLCVDVMEHIEQDTLVFRHFHKAMIKGGTLLISTPSDQGGSDVHEHNQAGEGAKGFIDEHVRDGYGKEELREKLLSAGFSEVNIRYQYGPPGRISWKLCMKYPIIMLNTSRLFFALLPIYYLIFFPVCLILNFADLRMHHKTGTGLIARAIK